MKEQIKDLKESSNFLISSKGYIISKERIYNNGKSDSAVKSEKILKISDKGYVSVITENKVYNKKIKEYVADNFLEYPKDFPKEFYSVYTKDGNELNADVSNLYFDISETAIRAFDLEGNWLADYPSPKIFSEKTGITVNNIYKACQGGQISTGNFQFRYLKVAGIQNVQKSLPSTIGKRRSDTTPIAKYWENKLICVYNSISEAAENNEIEITEVWESYERNKEVKGFLFKKII